MNSELVSIIVVSYNHEKFIIDCLESIKAQTYENIELILSDDCSPDNTYDLAKKWCDENRDRFSNLIAYRNEKNVGVTANCNRGLSNANGRYIKIFASDDILFPSAISDLVGYLSDNPQHDLVYSNVVVVDENAHFPVDTAVYTDKLYKKRPLEGSGLIDALYKGNFVSATGALIRKETFDKYGIYAEKYSFEDYEYWLRVAAKGGSIGYLDKVTAGYRKLGSSIDHFGKSEEEKKRFNKYINEHVRLLEEYKPYTSSTMDSFWNAMLPLLLRQGNYEMVNSIVSDKNIRLSFRNRIRLLQNRFYGKI